VPSGNLEISRYRIVYSPDIALAMYRELASHLEQIDENINAELFWQDRAEFSYLGSQIGGLWLTYPPSIPEQLQILIQKILNHYGIWTAEPNLVINS